MPTRLRSSQGSGQFCIMAFCIGHLPLLAWRLLFGKEVSTFLYGKFPHFPYPMRYEHPLNFFRGCYFLRCSC